MNSIATKAFSKLGQVPLSLMELNIDQAANRFVIIDRRNLDILFAGANTESSMVKTVLPLEYSVGNYCLVGILDDDGQYNAKFVDGVQCQLIDLNTANLSV